MSINRKLGDLANVLDDGTEGQVLSFNASGVIAASDIAAGASVYDSAALLPLSGLSAGDMAYVTGTNRFYISNGTGWYSVSLINTNPSITSVQDSAGGTTPFTLTTDGTATVITVTASDPEDVPLTYNYTVTSGSLTNGGGTTATVTQADNVFTVTPSTTEAYAGTFELTFTASDGINQGTSANSFTLSFITTITNSNYTTLLATATGTSDNNDITDASTNNHSITVTGDTHAGTFSPYRSGGYSTYFPGGSSIYLLVQNLQHSFGTNDFTIEFFAYITADFSPLFDFAENPERLRLTTTTNNGGSSSDAAFRLRLDWYQVGTGRVPVYSTDNAVNKNQWNHIAVCRSGSSMKVFANGNEVYSESTGGNYDYGSANTTDMQIGRWNTTGDVLNGNISNFRIINNSALYNGSYTVPTENFTAQSGTVLLTCHQPYIADGSTNDHTITVNGDVSTKPFSPYDYLEYSATDHGGSLYFNGTNSAVEIADNDDFDFGTGDLTIECWVYPEVTSNSYPGFLGTSAGWGSIAASGFRFDNLGDSKFQMSWYGPGDPFLETQSTYKHNQWYHFVVTRTGGSAWRMFVNGILEDTGTNSTAYDISIGGNNLQVGGKTWDGGNGWFKGNVADLRLTKGSVVSEYQTTSTTVGTKIFTPRTSPISSSGSELHIKGTDASIIDKAQGANLKLVGNTTGSTTTNFTGAKSIDLTGSNDYLVAESEDILTQDYTIETWIYAPTGGFTATGYVFDTRPQTSTQNGISLYMNSNTAYLRINGGTKITSSTTLSDQNWHHVAISRSGSNTKLFFNGSQTGSTYTVLDTIYSPKFFLGIQSYNTSAVNGVNAYLQDFRITKGLARYTANFTPPIASLEG